MRSNPHKDAIIALRNAQLEAGHALATRKSYRAWIIRYRSSRLAHTSHDLQSYLSRLATVEKVNPKTIHQALCALKFYHEKVLGIEIPPDSLTVPKINRNRNIPDWLTQEEAMLLLSHMAGTPRLMAEMLYGTGSRINALLTLRLKDLDLQKNLVTFRFDKGGKSRTVRLPASCRPRLMAHVSAVRLQWEADRQKGIYFPTEDSSLMRKLGKKRFGSLPFCWLFPSRDVRHGVERWHATDKALSDGLRRAAESAGIMKRITPHTLRHSNATALLELGENIRTIQEHLGHTHVETTEIYTHATGAQGVISPLDRVGFLTPTSSDILPFTRTA